MVSAVLCRPARLFLPAALRAVHAASYALANRIAVGCLFCLKDTQSEVIRAVYNPRRLGPSCRSIVHAVGSRTCCASRRSNGTTAQAYRPTARTERVPAPPKPQLNIHPPWRGVELDC